MCLLLVAVTLCSSAPRPKYYLIETVDDSGLDAGGDYSLIPIPDTEARL